jgi:hypothetical protein
MDLTGHVGVTLSYTQVNNIFSVNEVVLIKFENGSVFQISAKCAELRKVGDNFYKLPTETPEHYSKVIATLDSLNPSFLYVTGETKKKHYICTEQKYTGNQASDSSYRVHHIPIYVF